jgi:hypothetical protein
MSHQVREFVESMRIKLLNSSPYYAQANCQAEASNKVLIKIIKKGIKDSPRRWHEKLSEALWAHRTSRHGATKVTPFELVYGQEAVLPVELGLHSLRVTGQGSLLAKEYQELRMDKIDDVHKSRFKALEEIEIPNLKLVKAWIRLDKTNSVSDKANGISRVPSGLPGLAWGYPSYLEALSAKSKPKSGWQPNEEVFGRGQLKGT